MKKIKLFGKIIEIRAAGVEKLPPVSSDTAWQDYLMGNGCSISADTALQVAAVFRCVDLISKTMAALPLHMYRDRNDGKQKAKDHPLYKITNILPNPTTTAYEMMQMLVANILLTRGGYLRIVRNRSGVITALKNLPTANCSQVYTNSRNGEQYIYATADGITETLRDGDFVFIPGFRFASRTPEDPMDIAAGVLGLNDSMTKYAQRGFSGTSPGGYITYPGELSDSAYERFKEDFKANYAGVENAGKWMFLENGSTAQPWDRDMQKTQLLDSRKWAVTEICRIFGVPPHMCMDLEKATFSNIEQQSAAKAVKEAAESGLLMHLHACENNRGAPGTGSIDWKQIFEILDAAGYGGHITMETFLPGGFDAAWTPPALSPDETASAGLRFMKEMLQNVQS